MKTACALRLLNAMAWGAALLLVGPSCNLDFGHRPVELGEQTQAELEDDADLDDGDQPELPSDVEPDELATSCEASCITGICCVLAEQARFCVDIANDAQHCGECSRACAANESCERGSCTCGPSVCPQGFLCCTSVTGAINCVDPEYNPAHCGSCGDACGENEYCIQGKCRCGSEEYCSEGLRCCGSFCSEDCACPIDCRDDERCCDGLCVASSSPIHCGQCGNDCTGIEGAVCQDGACVCGNAFMLCGNACVSPDSVEHCGGCFQSCAVSTADGVSCQAGACQLACATGRVDCDGAHANGCEASHCRVRDGLLVFYDFSEGAGLIVRDRADALAVPLDLSIVADADGAWSWLQNPAGIEVSANNVRIGSGDTQELRQRLMQSGDFSVEAWVRLSSMNDGVEQPRRIISLEQGPNNWALTIGQEKERFAFRLQLGPIRYERVLAPTLDPNVLQQLVLSYSSTDESMRMYVNGQMRKQANTYGDWAMFTAPLSLQLFNEPGMGRGWVGVLHLAALYERALSDEEVSQNYLAGVQP